jgi:protoporphyrinogen oxidase
MGQVAIIGAGVSGLACALVLKEHKIDFEIFEASARPGGHARTNAVGNFRFDHGPHVLVGIPEPVLPLFSSLDLELRACSCNSSIYFRRNTHRSAYVPAPIQHNLAQLPLSVRISCTYSYLRARCWSRGESTNSRQRVERMLGQGLTDLFIAPYDSKRLGYPLEEIDAAYMDRVPKISPFEMLKNGLTLAHSAGARQPLLLSSYRRH